LVGAGTSGAKNAVRLYDMMDKDAVAGIMTIEKSISNTKRYTQKLKDAPKVNCDLTGYIYGGQEYHHDIQKCIREFPEWHLKVDEAINEFAQTKAKRPEVITTLFNTAGHVHVALYATIQLRKRFEPSYMIGNVIKPTANNELATEIYSKFLAFHEKHPIFDTLVISENENKTDSTNRKVQDYLNLTGLMGILEDTIDGVNYNKLPVFCKQKCYVINSEIYTQPYYPKFPFGLIKRHNYGTDVRLISDSIHMLNSVAGSHTTITADVMPTQFEDMQRITGENSKLHLLNALPAKKFYIVSSAKPETLTSDAEFHEFEELLEVMGKSGKL
jgi:hypothetical protein